MITARLTLPLLLLFGLSASAQDVSRLQIYNALQTARVLDPDRQLVHLSYTCTLRVEGHAYPVVDLQELVRGAVEPRGVNRIIILDSTLRPVQKIEYMTHRPLFCVENRLYVFGNLEIGNMLPEGNVLTFSNRARDVKLSHVEANDYPLPITRLRKSPPQ